MGMHSYQLNYFCCIFSDLHEIPPLFSLTSLSNKKIIYNEMIAEIS